jgi:hypothetical protein
MVMEDKNDAWASIAACTARSWGLVDEEVPELTAPTPAGPRPTLLLARPAGARPTLFADAFEAALSSVQPLRPAG